MNCNQIYLCNIVVLIGYHKVKSLKNNYFVAFIFFLSVLIVQVAGAVPLLPAIIGYTNSISRECGNIIVFVNIAFHISQI